LRALSGAGGEASIEAGGSLQDHEWTSLACRREERLIQSNCFFVPDPGPHFDAVGAQCRKPSPADEREWVLHCGHHATNSRSDNPLGTRAGFPGVNTRLERAVKSGAPSVTAGFFERVHLGVRLARTLVRTLPEHHPFVRHDASAHHRVRRRPTKAAARVLERPLHPPFVVYHFS
jgi:hypothetical protein